MSGFDDEDVYSVDDITWNDLSMEKVFKRINCTCSTPGEQMLYNMLRYPALDSTEYEKRKRLADIMGNDGELRFKLQKLLFSLGKKSEANTVDIFSPKRRSPLLLIVSIGIILLMLSFAVGMFINTAFALPFVITLTGAIIFHSIVLTKLQNDIKTVSYTA